MREERNGSKFSAIERQQMRAAAFGLHEAGAKQRDIAIQLNVSQATVSGWLRAHARQFPEGTPQQRAAEKIRKAMVCCDMFEQFAAVRGDLEAQQVLREKRVGHESCYYGEWAARIVEDVK